MRNSLYPIHNFHCFYFNLFSHEVRKSAFDLVESTTELFNVLIAKYGNTSDVS